MEKSLLVIVRHKPGRTRLLMRALQSINDQTFKKINIIIFCMEEELKCHNVFPHKAVQEALQPYAHVHDFVWCQEEPLNQGAWYCSQHHFREVIPFGAALRYAGRPASASPAVGYMSVHQKQQQDLVNDALNVD
ncbi:hypothetical protein GTL78_001465 [Salmonella enterica]|nr:hypothetical protein [Salmonella enterica]